MTSPVIGRASIQIQPQFANINQPIQKEFEKGSRQFGEHGRKAGQQFGTGFKTKLGPLAQENQKFFEESGKKSGTGFFNGIKSRFSAGQKDLEESGRQSGHRFFTGFTSRIGPRQFALTGGAIGSGLTAGIAGAVAKGAAVIGGAALFKNMVTGASDLSESISKSNVVFGKWSTDVVRFGSNAANGIGLSKQAAIESAATFGNLFVALKIGQQPAANMSTTMIKLAGDLASFNNVKPEEAVLALRSALVGETEPIRRFGVNMNDATLKAKALALGLKYSGDVLPPNIKAQAAYALILEQTKTAQGDFARTSGGMANQTRILRANLVDLSARAGAAFLPFVNKALQGVNWFVRALPGIGNNVKTFVQPAFNWLGGAFRTIRGGFTDGEQGATGFAGVLEKTGDRAHAVVSWFRGPFVVGIKAGISAFKDPDVTSGGFVGFMERVGSTGRRVADFFRGPFVAGIRSFVASFQGGAVGGVGFVRFMSQLGDRARILIPQLLSIGKTIVGWLVPSFRMIGEFLVGSVIPSVRSLAAIFFTTLLPAVKPTAIIVGATLLVAFRALAFLLSNVVGPTLRGVTGFLRAHQTAIAAVAVAVGTGVVVFGAYRLIVSGVALAQRLYTAGLLIMRGAIATVRVGVWLLNAAFAANPIGVVVLVVAALAAGFIYAYKHSETFRNIITTAWRVIRQAAVSVWEGFLRPIFTGWGTAIVNTGKAFVAVRDTFTRVWGVIKGAFRTGVAIVVGVFLDLVGAVINGAARAFGWVPGLGGKLKGAAASFNTFRDRVNASLNAVKDKDVKVRVQLGAGKAVVGSGAAAIRINKDGNILNRFAGGSERHIAQIAQPGEMRLWAEPETGGEAYIPLAGAKRGRSTAILSAVANRFGYNLTAAASGMIRVEDGSWVPASFFSNTGSSSGMVRAEDGSMVPTSFYGSTSSGRGSSRGLQVNPSMSGMGKFQAAVTAYDKQVTSFATKVGKAVQGLVGGPYSANMTGVVNFAKRIAGSPYVWGGALPSGSDCSGFVSMLVRVARGMGTAGRLFSTGTLPAGYFATTGRLQKAFRIGWFTGNPGHVAATVNGIGMESRGGDGVVVNGYNGRSAGSNQGIFNHHAWLKSLATGGIVRWGDVSGGRWDQLLAAGWRDRAGALYRPAPSWVTGGDGARAKMLRAHINRGGMFFEDFSYRGAPPFYRMGNDRLANHFWAGHQGFNFGGPQTRPVIGSWLNRVIRDAVYGIRQRRLSQGGILPGDPPFDLLSPKGRHYRPGLQQYLQLVNAGIRPYDTGGGKRWPSGTAGVNMSGEDEFVYKRSQIGGAKVEIHIDVDARGANNPAAVKAAVQAGANELLARLGPLLLTRPGVN